ncbi:hypothetical protein Tco_0262351 [Tanacetum coccineum]
MMRECIKSSVLNVRMLLRYPSITSRSSNPGICHSYFLLRLRVYEFSTVPNAIRDSLRLIGIIGFCDELLRHIGGNPTGS